MPYYVYRIHRYGGLEKVDEAAAFRDASARAKALRTSPDLPPGCAVKVVFAASDAEAEDLLAEERAPKPGLDGDE